MYLYFQFVIIFNIEEVYSLSSKCVKSGIVECNGQ